MVGLTSVELRTGCVPGEESVVARSIATDYSNGNLVGSGLGLLFQELKSRGFPFSCDGEGGIERGGALPILLWRL